MREAPSLTVIRGLQAAGAEIHAHDPAAKETAYAELGDTLTYMKTPTGVWRALMRSSCLLSGRYIEPRLASNR